MAPREYIYDDDPFDSYNPNADYWEEEAYTPPVTRDDLLPRFAALQRPQTTFAAPYVPPYAAPSFAAPYVPPSVAPSFAAPMAATGRQARMAGANAPSMAVPGMSGSDALSRIRSDLVSWGNAQDIVGQIDAGASLGTIQNMLQGRLSSTTHATNVAKLAPIAAFARSASTPESSFSVLGTPHVSDEQALTKIRSDLSAWGGAPDIVKAIDSGAPLSAVRDAVVNRRTTTTNPKNVAKLDPIWSYANGVLTQSNLEEGLPPPAGLPDFPEHQNTWTAAADVALPIAGAILAPWALPGILGAGALGTAALAGVGAGLGSGAASAISERPTDEALKRALIAAGTAGATSWATGAGGPLHDLYAKGAGTVEEGLRGATNWVTGAGGPTAILPAEAALLNAGIEQVVVPGALAAGTGFDAAVSGAIGAGAAGLAPQMGLPAKVQKIDVRDLDPIDPGYQGTSVITGPLASPSNILDSAVAGAAGAGAANALPPLPAETVTVTGKLEPPYRPRELVFPGIATGAVQAAIPSLTSKLEPVEIEEDGFSVAKAIDYMRAAGMLSTLLGGVGGSGGSSSSQGFMPGGLTGTQHPTFSAKLPAAREISSQRTLGPVDWLNYGRYPEEQFFARGGMAVRRGGRTDDVPAMLSDGEYVIDAETVALLGDGSSDAGAKRLDEFRVNLRKHKGKELAKGRFSVNAKRPERYVGKGR